MTHEDTELETRLLHRMVFFTDAVFAIVLTLLVLELRPPPLHDGTSAAEAFAGMSHHFLAFFMSFALIGVFWAAHLNTTRRLVHFDWPSVWANLLFLFPVCLIPFAAGWFGEGLGDPFVWLVYCAVLVVTSVGNVLLVLVLTRGGGRLLAGGVSGRERLYRLVRAAVPGVAFGVGLFLLQAGEQGLSQFCWVLIPILMGAAEFLKPKTPKVTDPEASAA
jgi:uncharacterized membrane protein